MRWAGPLVGLAANLGLIVGVVVGGWAPGNLWLTFLAENVAVGVLTWLRLRHQEGKRIFVGAPPAPVAGVGSRHGGGMPSSFFLPWYGIFTFVGGGFAIAAALMVGVQPDLTLWLPLALVVVRFGADIADLAAGQSGPGSGFLALAITRMLCLHVGVILGFGLAISYANGVSGPVAFLGDLPLGLPLLGVLALLLIKTVAELIVTLVLVATGRR